MELLRRCLGGSLRHESISGLEVIAKSKRGKEMFRDLWSKTGSATHRRRPTRFAKQLQSTVMRLLILPIVVQALDTCEIQHLLRSIRSNVETSVQLAENYLLIRLMVSCRQRPHMHVATCRRHSKVEAGYFITEELR